MNIKPENQTSLYGLNNHLNEFIDLYKREKLPNSTYPYLITTRVQQKNCMEIQKNEK